MTPVSINQHQDPLVWQGWDMLCKGHNRDGSACGNHALKKVVQLTCCRQHGGSAGLADDNGLQNGGGGEGRPITHGLYSKFVPESWRETYEYHKTNPEILSLVPEIAVSRTALSRFLSKCEGSSLTAEIINQITEHLDKLSRLTDRDAKRQYQERVVSEMISQQVETEAAILRDVVSQYVDAATADRIRSEFAARVIEGVKAKPSLSINP